jgi:uncharacterized membrane protein YkoI
MKVTKMRPLVILCLALMAGISTSGQAQESGHDGDRNRDRGQERAMADQAISLDEAVARAERRYDARVVRAEEKRDGDRIEYRIRLLGADGRVFEVRVDAQTGEER